jgi:hypothetical protein
MGLTSAYLIAVKNLGPFLNAIRSARAPDKFTLKFIEDLGFKSTNDRLFIPLLKGLRFIDDNGVPTQRYFDFLDESRWRAVLAAGMEEAYEDLFRLNKRAYKLPKADLAGKFKSLTQGKKSGPVLDNTVRTFMELAKLAEFEPPTEIAGEGKVAAAEEEDGTSVEPRVRKEAAEVASAREPAVPREPSAGRLIDAVSYRIEIVLPPVRDKAVYDAIFRSLKEHLL